jgi:hypothetical protein
VAAAAEAAYKKREAAARAEAAIRARKPGVRIGMTPEQVLNESSWGKPYRVNRTTSASGTTEQWVYGERNFLYFENGVLTTVHH